MAYLKRKSEWADRMAADYREQAAKLRASVPKNGNYARRRESLETLDREAGRFMMLAARYRREEEAQAA